MTESSALMVKVNDRPFACLVCQHFYFATREVKLNTSGMSLMGLDWANESATGVVCLSCGYVHEFVGRSLTFFEPASS